MSVMSAGLTVSRAVLGRDGLTFPPPPISGFGLPGTYVYDATTARRIPAVGRAIQLYGGMTKQMPMDAYRSGQPLPRPPFLDSPDPRLVWPRSRYVMASVEDYLLSGNTISLVTARGADGYPLSVMYLPINWVYVSWTPGEVPDVQYYYYGQQLNYDDVIHVARGVDRWYPVRGVGVVEEFVSSLDRAAMEEDYERSALSGGAVPSVAIITPQATLTQDVADEAKGNWLAKFGGPTREPAILPNGTQVIPLAWSPTDTQMVEARKMTLTDIANMFNLDSYWLGAAVQGMTYKTAAPQYQQILRTSIEPVLADFEQVWSQAWLPRGQLVRFDRSKLLAEDLPTTATALSTLVNAGIMTSDAAWQMLVGTPLAAIDNEPGPPPAALAAAAAPAPAAPDDTAPLPSDELGGNTD
jgi:HK97 family phage portal protein